NEKPIEKVEIGLPAGVKVAFYVSGLNYSDDRAEATIIKDAGDDPDVTGGAEICAEVKFYTKGFGVIVKGGRGIGVVTKPGLPVPVGQPAINPMPMKMIKDELCKVLRETNCPLGLEVTISVPRGEELAKKTLNERLGIKGGISILGTTGIVEPISTRAWTDTVVAAMSVARACGQTHVVLTPGRTSESAAMVILRGLAEESFIQMGDHVGFSLAEARKRGFTKVTIVAQFGKLVKMAMGATRTHVKDSTLELGFLADLAAGQGLAKKKVEMIKSANTAREVFLNLRKGSGGEEFFRALVELASNTAREVLGGKLEFGCILVDYEGRPV
ncbi:MAG TPA: cobalt-precorrin-5B (C(1))-methyltransferase, partial [Nitrospirota bacterium]|nr:cobalt-precorrin-5B (C(1))-methyltransferase [Nitrospirota bacterium]